MNDTKLQLTIRGIDAKTKEALVKKASQQGLSLNKFALKTLKQGAGTETSKTRYKAIKQILDANKIGKSSVKDIDEALAWSDKASIAKQQREES